MGCEFNRRDLIRIGAGAVLAAPAALAHVNGPKFFTPAEFALLDELTEIIIPTDEHSPGARAAKVAAYIDTRVAEAFEARERDDWRQGLKLVEELSQKMNGRGFLESTPDERVALLQHMARNEMHPKAPEEVFFRTLKHATARAYYTSKIGIHQEMEYKGNVMLQEFVGYEVK
ncbi:MAG TPA: gluconate 2-dehydrogenase subunit 3 family protein [Bryobacteraceae bacterium]|nr:gluconate 2-dehydrogenase subunit 3 family protein [Bryobacteraceae bacterium]